MDRSRSLEILKVYGVGQQVRRILREYWNKSTVVARAGGYYGTGLKGERGVTQGNPLSPTISNVVVDVLVRHWFTLAVKEAETRGERGREGRHQAALFYAYDGMVALSNPRWLKWVFTTLVGFFDRVGQNTNTGKTVSMTCRPCTAAENQSEGAYRRKMTGEGLTFIERKRERVECRDCGKEVAEGSLESHRMSQHGKLGNDDGHGQTQLQEGERGGRTKDISDRVPQGGDEGVSSGRMPGKGRD